MVIKNCLINFFTVIAKFASSRDTWLWIYESEKPDSLK